MKYCTICKKIATYGLIDEQTPKYCSNCYKDITDGFFVNFKHGYCEEIINNNGILLSERLCGKNANFNYLNCSPKKGIRCFEHKLENMLCINGKICIDCNKSQASFILPDSDKKSPTHCSECLKKYNIEKIDVSHKKCVLCKKSSATFGIITKEYCSKCVKKENLDVYDLHHKQCILCNVKDAVFNIKGEKSLYCGDCKKDNMINIYGLKCEGCNSTTPTFNYPGIKDKRFCKDCAYDGMINVKDKLCEKCNKKRPSPNYCSDCKTEYMINVNCSKCNDENCNENAWYNYENEKKVKFCKEHSLKGMINLKIGLCNEQDCNLVASFNYMNEKNPIYCFNHKKDTMENIICHTLCKECPNRASFNYYGEKKPMYCSFHKESIMVNVCHKLCKTNLCGTIISEKYDGYCMICFIHLFPDKPITRNYKTKETDVKNYILNSFPDLTWVTDKKIQDGCSKRRPDLLLDLGYQIIIIEIDENQHITYDSSCEYKRLVDISDDLGNRPIILIKFNPDDYILEDGTKKHSCWSINNKGLCTVKKTYQNEWKNRLNNLREKITFWLNPENKINDLIHFEYLFFDEKL
jgi:hypothetical protein